MTSFSLFLNLLNKTTDTLIVQDKILQPSFSIISPRPEFATGLVSATSDHTLLEPDQVVREGLPSGLDRCGTGQLCCRKP